MKLRDVAERLGCRLEGDGDIEVNRVEGIERAGPGDLTFFANPRYTQALRSTAASAVILGPDVPAPSCAVLRAANPYLAFADAVALFATDTRPAPGVHTLSAVAADAQIGSGVSIGPFVVIGSRAVVGDRSIVHANVVIGLEAVIGDDCLIHASVSIRERVTIGNRVIVHDGAVLGSDGFGFARRPDGSHRKIPQAGTVVIEDDVEIGANTVIDRPAVGETRVASGTKIDNLVQIAHGVSLGRNVLLAAQVGIAGSTTIEDDVMLAGQVGVAGHLTIGRGTVATAQTGVPNSTPPGAFVSGYPAIDNRAWLKASAIFRKLPELKREVARIEARLAELERRPPDGPVDRQD